MSITSPTYRVFTKSFALLLLAGFLLPAGLQAKHLVDFCMTEMNSHEMMDSSHDCCDSPEEGHPELTHSHHHCDKDLICACSVDPAPLNKENWIPVSSSSAVILQKNGFDHAFFSSNETIRDELQARIGQHNPPLYLLYDTFLN